MKALQRYQMSKAEEAALKAEIVRQVHELDEKFSAEICAMLLWALHEEFGFGADRLRRVWDCVAETVGAERNCSNITICRITPNLFCFTSCARSALTWKSGRRNRKRKRWC